MANLIITIISIALVAVAALMGAYYGGAAFLNGQAKANANAAVSQGEQQVAAWSVYAADRSGNWTLSALAALSATSPTAYVTSLPISPGGVTSSTTVSAWTLVNLSDVSGGTSANYDGVYFRLTDDTAGLNVCNNVAIMIGGSAATPTKTSVANNIFGLTPSGRKFDCIYFDASATAATTSTPKYIYYRAY